jgi:hypothetical protein
MASQFLSAFWRRSLQGVVFECRARLLADTLK